MPVAFEPDEPELPLELELDAADEPDDPPSVLFVGLAELVSGFAAPPSLFVSGFASPADFCGALAYKSAYQPPPFKMNPAPPET